MPRVAPARTKANGPWPTSGVVTTFTAANVTDKQETPCTGRELIVARNSGASSRTITIEGVPIYGRDGDITAESIAAGAVKVFGPFNRKGFRQTDGMIYFEANNAEVLFAVIEF